MFGGAGTNTGNAQPDANNVFADVFDEVLQQLPPRRSALICVFQLLRPEVERHIPWWAWLGTLCGAGLGFIIANFPGLMLGAVAGNRLGAIRDAKGKSVAAVFNELGGQQKAEVSQILIYMSLHIPNLDVFLLGTACIGDESPGIGFVRY